MILDFLKNYNNNSFIKKTYNSLLVKPYISKNEEEEQFLELMKNIMRQPLRGNRTNELCKSLFSPPQLRFSLSNNNFPLITTRQLPFKIIFEELMWFIRGETDTRILNNKGIHIWDDNSSREFLDNRGLQRYREGDIGPGYGFQFRYSGAVYESCDTDYTGCGTDQLLNVIKEIREQPNSRRLIINLWNPNDIHKMALPPCGFCYQFYVNDNKLSCKLTQRSSDISLAGGWNIASASLLTIMIACVCDLEPHELIWSLGDVHIYNNQQEQVFEQLSRRPRMFPKLYITNTPSDRNITSFKYSDFELLDYNPYCRLRIPMNP